MGEIINFPGTEKEVPEESDIWQTLIYRWWMSEYYPMFEEAGKIRRSYLTYGHLIEVMMELVMQELISYDDTDDEYYQLAMVPEVHQMINESIIKSLNASKTDKEIKENSHE